MLRYRILFIFVSTFFLPFVAFSWNTLTHKVIANIAYQNLTPSVKEKVDNLVGYFHQQYPEMGTFLDIAYWPDALRSQKIETYTHWHYINTAFSKDDTPLKNLIERDNAVWAINSIEPAVKNVHANVNERVRFLAFLVHIVGDLHQPLHTVSYISVVTPDGDKGGNSYFVRYKNQRINLHTLWDKGVDAFAGDNSQEHVNALTTLITSTYPKSYFGNRINYLKPEDWIQEGLWNAKEYAYTVAMEQVITAQYVELAQRISKQEAALAGYRIAKILNQLL